MRYGAPEIPGNMPPDGNLKRVGRVFSATGSRPAKKGDSK